MNTPAPEQDDDLTRLDTRQINPATAVHAGSENCLPIGSRLGDFEITGIVGEGGFGIVYLAFDHSLRRTVAIKEYMPVALAGRGVDDSVLIRSVKHTDAFGAGLESYINEARLLAQFDHPSLVKVYRFWKQNKTAYMAMQYYEGHTLKHIAEFNPEIINEAWLTNMLRAIIGALETLYSAQILHRDISPENIMIQHNGVPVLLDFGAARQVIGGTPQDLTVILKPSFAPVEQYADDSNLIQGQWTDIYALCAVAYSVIARKTPPGSVTRMIKDPMQRLQDLAPPGYSHAFLAAIDQGLSVLPEFRPQSTAEFRALLSLEAAPKLAPQVHAKVPPQFTARVTPASPLPPGAIPNAHTSPVSGEAGEPDDDDKTMLAVPVADKPAAASASKPAGKTAKDAAPGATTAMAAKTQGWHWRWDHTLSAAVLVIAAAGIWLWTSGGKPATPATADTAGSPASSVAATPAPASNAAATTASAADSVAHLNPVFDAAPTVASTPAAAAASTASQLAVTLDKNETIVTDVAAADASKAAEVLPTGTVSLNIKPWGTLYINGTNKGVSPPLKKLQLPPGKYQVKIVNPNFPDYQTDVQLANKKTVAVAHDFTAQGSTP
ncbi:protein kinase domain-containing protein [Undibacterium sp. TJN25]|uniref:protein kinase domain-containing protein n=1 Tax=Undibacterium sp. TJN25 TaxID=3413056 RepID=UPI003BF26ABD